MLRPYPQRQRRSLRLTGFDYAQAGAYFVTICARDRECLFGDIIEDQMMLNQLGETVQTCWNELPRHFPHVRLDAFVVMPNHVHGVVVLTQDVGAQDVGAQDVGAQHAAPLQNVRAGSLGVVIRSFKSVASKRVNALHGAPGTTLWQRNYYEHVIRNEAEWDRIRDYIVHNPVRWATDDENPASKGPIHHRQS